MKGGKVLWSGFVCLLWVACSGPNSASVAVRDAWVREPPGGHPIAAAYMTLTNESDRASALVGAEASAAERVEMHSMTHEGGTMRMRQIERIELPVGQDVQLQSGGLHLMLMGMDDPPRAGDQVELTLRFADGTEQTLRAPVRRGL